MFGSGDDDLAGRHGPHPRPLSRTRARRVVSASASGWVARAMPRMARLLALVPPLVKISRSRRGGVRSAPRWAIRSRAFSSAGGPAGRADADWPDWHKPQHSTGHGFHHFRAGGRGRIVVEVNGGSGEIVLAASGQWIVVSG